MASSGTSVRSGVFGAYVRLRRIEPDCGFRWGACTVRLLSAACCGTLGRQNHSLLTREYIMQVGSIVRSVHIAVPAGARGIVTRMLGNMAMVVWYAGEPGASLQLS